MIDYLMEAKALYEHMLRHRRYLHSHAETGFDLNDTCAYVKKALREMGLAPKDCGRSGIVCTIGFGDTCFLLRADMDALPIQEEAGQAFDCQNGCMHACGHDLHTAMLLGAAELLKKHEKELQGCVKLMFQPAEETLRGAEDMIRNGVLENPRPVGGMMLHVMTGVPIKTGTVIISAPGVSAPEASMFELLVRGRGGHGASPEETVDPIHAAAHILLALQSIKARELPSQSGAMLTIGAVQGGEAPNVIANQVLMRGSLRAYSAEECDKLRRRTEEIARMTAQTFGATAEFHVTSGTPTLINDRQMVESARKTLPGVLGAQHVLEAEIMGASRSSGSEDFACVSHEIPSVMLALAAGGTEDGYTHGLHHPHTRFDEAAMPYGAAALAGMAMHFLAAHEGAEFDTKA